MGELRENGRGRFRAPAGQAGKAVGAVADEREVVRYRCRQHAELRDDAVSVDHAPRASIELHDVIADNALRKILVRRADQHLLGVLRGLRGSCGERVVGLVLGHRPDYDAHQRERLLKNGKLCVQLRVDASACLVAGPHAIAKRLDDVIGRDRDMRHIVAQ